MVEREGVGESLQGFPARSTGCPGDQDYPLYLHLLTSERRMLMTLQAR